MNETEFLNILSDWNYWGSFDEQPYARPDYLARVEKLHSQKTATVLLGVRRAGKSSLIYLFINQKIKKGHFQTKDTLIINFEDPRFYLPLSSDDLFKIYEAYLKHLDPSLPLVVLDEVQNVQGWEKFVRYLLETKKAQVIVTGSSSKTLGREISTVLTGRHVDIEVFPLSFPEFLQFKGLTVTNAMEIAKHRVTIKRLFDEYAQWGGFPEVVLSDSALRKRELLTRYFEDILIKDVVKRFGIKEIEKLEQLASLFISNMATLQSLNKIKDRVGASLDTVQRFASYLETARLFFMVQKFDYSLGQQIRSISKVYTVDPGFYAAKGFRFSENYGHIAENMAAIELFRRCAFDPLLEIYYWKDQQQREVDFVVKAGAKIKQLIQVCWNLNQEKTREREIKSLLKAGVECNCEELLVITDDYEAMETLSQNGAKKPVRFLPLWRWLLSHVSPGH
ncbi:ATP-binding protein [candidate division KSB1 bacterium]|nr:ATP-binding protein [candidate division KSB1 bacterium]